MTFLKVIGYIAASEVVAGLLVSLLALRAKRLDVLRAQEDSPLIVEIDAYLTAYVKHEAFRQTVNDKTARSNAEMRRLLGLDHPSRLDPT